MRCAPTMVRSVRLPIELDQAVAKAAKAAAVPKSTWIRQAIEAALAMQADQDEPISRADALRALTLLRPARHVAQPPPSHQVRQLADYRAIVPICGRFSCSDRSRYRRGRLVSDDALPDADLTGVEPDVD